MSARPQPDNGSVWWWERSPNSGNSNNFCDVNSSGTTDNNNANNTGGLAPFGYVSFAEDGSASEVTGGIRSTEMQGAATMGGDALNPRRHADGAGTRRPSKAAAIARFEDVFSFENLYEAGVSCCNGVRWKASTQMFEARLPSWVAETQDRLLAGTWEPMGFNSFTICERGKMRHIQACHIAERMVQKCLVRNCLRPLVLPRLISDSHATIPGHGTELALRRLKEHLRWHHRRHGTDGYSLVMDYHDYFGTIDHEILKGMYARLPIDARCLRLTNMLIDQFEGSRGIGLGSEISQLSAVLYVSPVDHCAKDLMGTHCYGRYMDDSYAIIPSRDDADALYAAVLSKSAELGLVLNSKATRIKPLAHGMRYLKKRVSLTESGRVVMRPQRDNMVRERRRLRRNAEAVRDGRMTPEAEEQSFECWKSHLLTLDAHRSVRAMETYRRSLLC